MQLPVYRDHEDIAEQLPETSTDPHQKVQSHTSQLMSDVNSTKHEVASTAIQVVNFTFDHGTRQEEWHFRLGNVNLIPVGSRDEANWSSTGRE